MKECVFCNAKNEFSSEQTLYNSSNFYLCVPKGQIVPGFLIASSYHHINTMSNMSIELRMELNDIIRTVLIFYKKAFNCNYPIIYEQGRGGGGAVIDDVGDFPLHFHLCFLPIEYNLHYYFGSIFKTISLNHLEDFPCLSKPYIYLSCEENMKNIAKIYTSITSEQEQELSHFRLKEHLKKLLPIKNAEQWRMSEDEDAILMTIELYNKYMIC